MDFAILFGCLFGLLILGVPIGVCLGCGTLAVMIFTTDLSPVLLAQSCFTGLDSFTLLAIPFFVVAGSFMMYGGISRRLLNLFNKLVGHVTGRSCRRDDDRLHVLCGDLRLRSGDRFGDRFFHDPRDDRKEV